MDFIKGLSEILISFISSLFTSHNVQQTRVICLSLNALTMRMYCSFLSMFLLFDIRVGFDGVYKQLLAQTGTIGFF